jgi:hypothetical protein
VKEKVTLELCCAVLSCPVIEVAWKGGVVGGNPTNLRHRSWDKFFNLPRNLAGW